LSNKRVAYLVNCMNRGTFRPEWVNIITCVLNGVEYRMNGQHTAWARLEKPANWRCPVTHMKYEAGDAEDMRRLYSSIDRGGTRSTGDVTISYLYGTAEFDGLGKKALRTLVEGFGFWKWEIETERLRHDADDRCYLLKTDAYQLAKHVVKFLMTIDKESRHIMRRPVVAAMFATYNKAIAAADDFWSPVRDGTGMRDSDDPRLKLRNALMSSSVNIGNGVESKKAVSSEEMFRWCIQAWNCYRVGQSLKQVKALLDKPRSPVK